MDSSVGKHDRILGIYSNLMEGAGLNVKSAARHYHVSTKSIKRDIEDIRNFLSEKLSETGGFCQVVYDRSADTYRLEGDDTLTSKELFALCKVLLESRAFRKSEFSDVLRKLIDRCVYDKDAAHIKDMLANETYHYCEPLHNKSLIQTIWDLSLAIKECRKIKVRYERLTEPRIQERVLEPVGLMFSDYYFYLAAYIPEKQTKNPTIYRIDRIDSFTVLKEKFSIPYANRFEEGEFRKRIQFMYGGELMRVKFRYFGESVEAILDRLPTAEVISQKEGEFTVKAEVFGRGITPWILSQANYLEVLEPAELRNDIKEKLTKMTKLYE